MRLEGEAEAASILARGTAEAKALDAKARAFAEFGEAAVFDLLVKVLPDVVREASAPLAAVDRMTVISSDGAGSLARSVAGNIESGLQISSDLTGTDLRALLASLSERWAARTSRTARATARSPRARPPPRGSRPASCGSTAATGSRYRR